MPLRLYNERGELVNADVTLLTRFVAEALETNSKLDSVLDVLERVQQQGAKSNEDENLEPGRRHYDV